MRIVLVGNHAVSFSSESHHAKSLELLGHEVVRLQEGATPGEAILEESVRSDALVFVHTHSWITPGKPLVEVLELLKTKGIPTLTYHLDLWFGIARQNDLENDPFYKHIGHFFTVDKLMADWFNDNTDVKGHYLPAGVFGPECELRPQETDPVIRTVDGREIEPADIIFVGSKGYHPEWQWRPELINWLRETYGDRFKHVGGDGLGTVRGEELNRLYANSKIAVGDSLVLGFDYPYYWSDRVYETTGRGGFLLMPEIKGLDQEFNSGEIATFKFGNFGDLKHKIDYYLEHDDEREAMRVAGYERTANHYTYGHRWQTILETVGLG